MRTLWSQWCALFRAAVVENGTVPNIYVSVFVRICSVGLGFRGSVGRLVRRENQPAARPGCRASFDRSDRSDRSDPSDIRRAQGGGSGPRHLNFFSAGSQFSLATDWERDRREPVSEGNFGDDGLLGSVPELPVDEVEETSTPVAASRCHDDIDVVVGQEFVECVDALCVGCGQVAIRRAWDACQTGVQSPGLELATALLQPVGGWRSRGTEDSHTPNGRGEWRGAERLALVSVAHNVRSPGT